MHSAYEGNSTLERQRASNPNKPTSKPATTANQQASKPAKHATHLGVRLRAEFNPLRLEFPPEFSGVIDGPVMHEGDAVVEVHVGVSVFVGLAAYRDPRSGVPQRVDEQGTWAGRGEKEDDEQVFHTANACWDPSGGGGGLGGVNFDGLFNENSRNGFIHQGRGSGGRGVTNVCRKPTYVNIYITRVLYLAAFTRETSPSREKGAGVVQRQFLFHSRQTVTKGRNLGGGRGKRR